MTVTILGSRSQKYNNCRYNFICNLNVAVLGLIQDRDCEEHKDTGPNIDNKIKSLSPKVSLPARTGHCTGLACPNFTIPHLNCRARVESEYKKLWTLSSLTQHGIITTGSVHLPCLINTVLSLTQPNTAPPRLLPHEKQSRNERV